MKKALITGVTGQDGSYLSEFLISKGYDVHGTIRRSSTDFRERIAHLEGNPRFHLHYADMADSMSLMKVIMDVQPDEIYNLAAQSHVRYRSMCPNTQPTQMPREFCACLRQCARPDSPTDAASIRHPLPNYTARWRKFRRTKKHLSIPTAPTPWQSSTASGS